jgi:hypothetical protein
MRAGRQWEGGGGETEAAGGERGAVGRGRGVGVERGLSPLDDELELLPGTLTPRLQARLVRLGSWMPLEPA